jgi:predicted esterase
MLSHHISVSKTARYYTLGSLNERTEEVWFVVHGFAQLAGRFLEDFESMDNGSRYIIAPEGLNKFYLRAGQPDVGATWMTREDRESEMKDYVDYLNKLYDTLVLTGHSSKVVVLGFSQGVATVSRWVYQNKRRIDSLIFYAGEPGNELQNPDCISQFTQSRKTLLLGKEDKYFNEVWAEKYKVLLSGFEFVSFDGGHEIKSDLLPSLV